MKSIIKHSVEIICCSYTMMVLFFILANDDIAPTLNRTTLAQTFLICVVCAFVIQIMIRFNFRYEWMYHIVNYITLLVCIFGVGTFMLDLIPLEYPVVVAIPFFTLCIYIVCWYCFFMKNKNDADVINAQLKEKYNDKHH